MPIYDFACKCGKEIELFTQTMCSSEDCEEICPSCGSVMAKQIAVANVRVPGHTVHDKYWASPQAQHDVEAAYRNARTKAGKPL